MSGCLGAWTGRRWAECGQASGRFVGNLLSTTVHPAVHTVPAGDCPRAGPRAVPGEGRRIGKKEGNKERYVKKLEIMKLRRIARAKPTKCASVSYQVSRLASNSYRVRE